MHAVVSDSSRQNGGAGTKFSEAYSACAASSQMPRVWIDESILRNLTCPIEMGVPSTTDVFAALQEYVCWSNSWPGRSAEARCPPLVCRGESIFFSSPARRYLALPVCPCSLTVCIHVCSYQITVLRENQPRCRVFRKTAAGYLIKHGEIDAVSAVVSSAFASAIRLGRRASKRMQPGDRSRRATMSMLLAYAV